jgi:hypothetical protein
MKETRNKLTLDQPVVYQIKVPGHLDASWMDPGWELTITVNHEAEDPPVTTLVGTFDQAGLQGLLRRLYSLGSPLITVNRL